MGRATDFSNCYIYYILDKDGVVHYVGSTSNLNSRRSKHKYNCNHEYCKEYNLDIYQYIRNNGGFDNFQITPVRKIENVNNKTELLIAERLEMEKFTGLKNMRGSFRSEKEKVEMRKQWKKDNPEKHSENSRIWRENNPEKYKQIYEKYRENNIEKIRERDRIYSRKRYAQKKQLEASEQ